MNRIPIFLSSAHYGLEDLRGELSSFLEGELEALPLVSSETGFPDYPGLPPYAQCLRVLENALIVVGVVDRRYGKSLQDWGPFPQYAGLSPTHAELRHALAEKKRLIIFVRSEVQGYYDIYRKNKAIFEQLDLPAGLDLGTLHMFEELKHAEPAPWIESFRDVRDIKVSIRRRLLQDLFDSLKQREALARLGAEFLVDYVLKLERSMQQRLLAILAHHSPEKEEKLRNLLIRIEHDRVLAPDDRFELDDELILQRLMATATGFAALDKEFIEFGELVVAR